MNERLLLSNLAVSERPYHAWRAFEVKAAVRTLTLVMLTTFVAGGAAPPEKLSSDRAKAKIAEALGIDKPDRVEVTSIAGNIANDAVVEAKFTAAFRFTKSGRADWLPVEVRIDDRQWESIELISTAVRKEKILRTSNELKTLALALEAFRRDKGFFVQADSGAALIDNLAPAYLKSVIRIDSWSNEFQYQGTAARYRLASRGPDGKPDTGDDIVVENGTFVKGGSD
jgi:hypothetical protein